MLKFFSYLYSYLKYIYKLFSYFEILNIYIIITEIYDKYIKKPYKHILSKYLSSNIIHWKALEYFCIISRSA